ncbi:proprotein convertase subtilisin kexin type [Mactra antiquata]
MSATTEIKSCNIHKVEFVTLTFSGKFLYRENATIFLTSARRTDVVMMAARRYDTEYADFTFNFSTPHFWGEYPKGTWYLHTLSDKLTNQMFLYEWRLTITGTAEVLETTTPSPNATEPTTEAGATGINSMSVSTFILLLFCCFCCDGIEVLSNEESLIETEEDNASTAFMDRDKRAIDEPTDANWTDQWNLQADTTPSMGVLDVWQLGYTGKGVVIAIVDSGVNASNPELADNYDADNSYDFVKNQTTVELDVNYKGNGTKIAGLVAASKNSDCIVGVAYGATYGAIKILKDANPPTDDMVADALEFNNDTIDIYSNSWGPKDDGVTIDAKDGLGEKAKAAIKNGIENGRGGKGSIYLFSSGEGGDKDDDCNVNGYVSSEYTITIGSIDKKGSIGKHGETCASILAVTYGGHSTSKLTTTDNNGTCSGEIYGAHAATPIAAGIIALVLEANPDLTWRDVQYLIVENAKQMQGSDYKKNGADYRVSLEHGFGLMDAKAMVAAAKTWAPVNEQLTCSSNTNTTTKYKMGKGTMELNVTVDNCTITAVERVVLYIKTRITNKIYTDIKLVSPAGTTSTMLGSREYDHDITEFNFRLGSVHFWGENPLGNWTLKIEANDDFTHVWMYEFNISLTGAIAKSASAAKTPAFVQVKRTTPEEGSNTLVIVGFVLAGLACAAVIGLILYFKVYQGQKAKKGPPRTANGTGNRVSAQNGRTSVSEAWNEF